MLGPLIFREQGTQNRMRLQMADLKCEGLKIQLEEYKSKATEAEQQAERERKRGDTLFRRDTAPAP